MIATGFLNPLESCKRKQHHALLWIQTSQCSYIVILFIMFFIVDLLALAAAACVHELWVCVFLLVGDASPPESVADIRLITSSRSNSWRWTGLLWSLPHCFALRFLPFVTTCLSLHAMHLFGTVCERELSGA